MKEPWLLVYLCARCSGREDRRIDAVIAGLWVAVALVQPLSPTDSGYRQRAEALSSDGVDEKVGGLAPTNWPEAFPGRFPQMLPFLAAPLFLLMALCLRHRLGAGCGFPWKPPG